MSRLAVLDQLIRDAGVPIDGLSGSGPGVRIDFREEATPNQRAAAHQLAATFDWRERRPKSTNALMSEIQSLQADEKQNLLIAVAAQYLQSDPSLAKRFNINIEGDQV